MSKRATETVKAVTRLDFKEAINCLFTSPNNLLKFAITNEQIREFYAEHIEPILLTVITSKIKRRVDNLFSEGLAKFENDLHRNLIKTVGEYNTYNHNYIFKLYGYAEEAIKSFTLNEFNRLISEAIEKGIQSKEAEIRKEFEAREASIIEDINVAIEERVIELYKNKTVNTLHMVLAEITKEM